MKMKMSFIILLAVFSTGGLQAEGTGICSLNIKDILEVYNSPIEKLQEFESAKNQDALTENRLRINFLSRHITALKIESENDISEHLKTIYKDSIITLYEELDKLQAGIITENIKSINEVSEYLVQVRSKKQEQDEIIKDIGIRVAGIRGIMDELSATFDAYDNIIERQNELIDTAVNISPEAYTNTIVLAPGLEAGTNLNPYISLGLGYLTHEGLFSYGGMLEAGYSPGQELVNVSFSVLLGFNLERNKNKYLD